MKMKQVYHMMVNGKIIDSTDWESKMYHWMMWMPFWNKIRIGFIALKLLNMLVNGGKAVDMDVESLLKQFITINKFIKESSLIINIKEKVF